MEKKSKHNLRDNHGRGKVHEFLEDKIKTGSDVALVTAYFTVFAYVHMQPVLARAKRVRLLFGDPAFIGGFEAQTGKAIFSIQDEAVTLAGKLKQKSNIAACRDWFAQSVEVRSVIEPGFLHGKMAHIDTGNDAAHAIVGSSNFTVRGLGLAKDSNNVELNLIAGHNIDVDELLNWYNDLWNDVSKVKDVKAEILAHLDRFYEDQTPEFIYQKTLFHVFGSQLQTPEIDDSKLHRGGLKNSAIWEAMYDFQRSAAKSAIDKLKTYGGCILADSVGLGKTFTALAVMKYFSNKDVLVLCPKKLEQNWQTYRDNSQDNPFASDRIHFDLYFHSDMGRPDAKLDIWHWANYDLVVIDESHNFRNNAVRSDGDLDDGARMTRYQFLMEKIIKGSGGRTKVLLLSATPVNNTLVDLRNQISFMAGADVAKDKEADQSYAAALGLESVDKTIRRAQQRFLDWSKKPADKRHKADLIATLGGDFSKLLDSLTIARSREHISRFFGHGMARLGGFPARAPVHSEFIAHIDSHRLFPDFESVWTQLDKLKLPMFTPSTFLREDLPEDIKTHYAALRNQHLTQETREKTLVAIMKVLFLKRLESSVYSFTATLARTIANIDVLISRIDRHAKLAAEEPDFDLNGYVPKQEDDEDLGDILEVGKKLKYKLAHLDLAKWQAALRADKSALLQLYESAKPVNAARDLKLTKLKELIAQKLQNQNLDKAGNANRKVIVFTAFADTAQYLYDSLRQGLLSQHSAHSGLVMGSVSKQTANPARTKFNDVLTDFSPTSKRRNEKISGDIDILFATDCISEGQNLQDCDTVINYDIHWNPVRIIQRFGRIDRIGSAAHFVRMVNFWPTEDLDQYITLKNRVEARMALVDIAATQTDNPLAPDTTNGDLRNKQLERLATDIPDLDEDDSQITLADLTLDEFRQDLHQFLDAQRQALETAPLGLFAVVPPDSQIPQALAGTLFCLREKPDAKAMQAVFASTYYLLYVRDNGEVALTHLQAKATLNLWRALSIGKTTAYSDLCRMFDRSTNNGTNMTRTTELLQAAIANVRHASERSAVQKITSQREFILQPRMDRLGDETTFELVTWLVIQAA
jgi:ERCC4-related helicase